MALDTFFEKPANANSLFGTKVGAEEKVVIIGLPFGHGSSQASSCPKAPPILRALSSNLNLKQGFLWDQAARKKMFFNESISDMGDIRYIAHNGVTRYLANVEAIYDHLLKNKKTLFSLGGDHLVTLPILKAINRYFPEFQVIHIDAHSDFQNAKEEDLPTHANFLNFACRFKGLRKIIQIGIRTLSGQEVLFDDKMTMASPENFEKFLIPNVPIYLSVDTDAMDPFIAPGVNHPVLNGLQWNDVDWIVNTLRKIPNRIIGLDWVEYAPHFDTGNKLTGLGILSSLLKFIPLLTEDKL